MLFDFIGDSVLILYQDSQIQSFSLKNFWGCKITAFRDIYQFFQLPVKKNAPKLVGALEKVAATGN
jgi:hypothetical protein